jgi:N-acetyl sugar amidotransferase
MDTTDPDIIFDKKGECSYCKRFDEELSPMWYRGEDGKKRLNTIVEKLKKEGKGKEYDCIIGLSGGVDSAYMAYVGSQLGLRMLAVHVDAGWNSELAVKNIENLVKKCNIDLFTHVVDWEAMKSLQLAFFKSATPNQDIPQDHSYFAALYTYAVKNGITYVLTGSNFATESVLPQAWGYDAMDAKFVKSVFSKHGKGSLKNYPIVNFWKYYIYYPYIKKMKKIKLLNYMEYNKGDAIKLLEEKVDFKYYGGKHFESRFTKFFQAHYLPTKFGYDKRRAHLASLVLSHEINREEAITQMSKAIYDEGKLNEDKEYIAKKLDLTVAQFDDILSIPIRSYTEYANSLSMKKFFTRIKGILMPFLGNRISPNKV